MRLLQLKNNGDFSLTKDLIHDLPPYAILSHTWGDENQEVTFKDLMEHSGSTKSGYGKIQFCATQAARDGLQHFWVDTCCIDKSSSAELTEAINSMFRWYRNAAKCYVYLSDVSLNNHDQSSGPIQSWDVAFRNSRWFTRGWTLQELIAPPNVEFFSIEGEQIGDKKSLERQVHEVTGVATGALEGRTLSAFSVAERMSWAERRNTTREEDKAYSLLGIFDTYLPLIYGEGRENALRRLKTEIDSKQALPPIPAQRALQLSQPFAQPPSAVIPFRRDRDFVERTALNKLLQRASEPGTRIGLVGLGGVGKSQLAIEYAYRVRETHPDTWVFWVHASSITRFEESYRDIAARLRLPGWNEPKVDKLSIVHAWLSDESSGRWTMVVDNADDATIMFEPWNGGASMTIAAASMAPSLSTFLPLSTQSSIVITSRSREVVERLQVFDEDVLDVKPMEIDVAETLLLKKLKKTGLQANTDDLVRLVKYLDCMPLAITQAAAYIEQVAPRMTVSRYTEKLEESDSQLTALLQKDIRDPRRDRQASNSIIMTWHVTFTHLRQTHDSAARLLALMSLFDREAIPDHLLQGQYAKATNSEIDFEDDVATLRAYGLIGMGVSDHLFDMHRLVQLSTQKWLDVHTELQEWQERYIDILDIAFPNGDYANWTTCQALFPHVEAMEKHRVTDTQHLQAWARVLYNGAWYAITRGQYGMAEKMARASLSGRQETLDVDDVVILDGTDILASVLKYQGEYKQAEEMNRRALTGWEKTLGVDHPHTLTSVSNLALVLRDQGEYKQAEEMNRRALTGWEKTLGVDHPHTLTSVSNLASVLRDQGEYKQAEEMNRRALTGREKTLGVDHPGTLTSVSNLASVLRDQGEYKQAEEMTRRALIGREKTLGVDHPDTLTSVSNLASVLRDQGEYKQAEEMNRRALTGREKTLGVDHPHTLTSVSNLASVLRDQGEYKQAEEMTRRALIGREKTLGVDHPDTLTSVYCLAHLLSAVHNCNEALHLYERAIIGYKKALGPGHPTTVACQRDRALLAEEMNGRSQ